jgi:hypothetical protein
MEDSEKYEDPKDAHKKFENQKKKEKYEKEKDDKKEKPKSYCLKYGDEKLVFVAGDSKGILSVSDGEYPVFVREKVLTSEEWKAYQKQVNKALESGKTAGEKAEGGVKIIKKLQGKDKGKDWVVAGGSLVMIELKVFGVTPGKGDKVWDWRAVGVRDDSQACAFFLEGLSEAHVGSKLSDLCVKIEKDLVVAPSPSALKADAENLKKKSAKHVTTASK